MRHPIVEADLATITSADLPWEEFEGKTILISGASGFLPAYMVETVLYLNETRRWQTTQVLGIVRNEARARARFKAYGDRSDLQFLVQDVNLPILSRAPIDYIIHAASQASPKYFGSDPIGTLSANVLGTHHLLELAHARQVKGFLFFSTSEVYGRTDTVPISEPAYGYLDLADVRSCYAESKRMGEAMCVAYAQQLNIPVKIVRPFHTYGPGMRLDDGRVFADFVADVLGNRHITLKSDGSATRSFCYIADATIGFFTVLLRGQPGQAYNLGNPNGEMSILNLARLLVQLFPEKELRIIRNEQAIPTGYLRSTITHHRPDISKIQKLGWQPTTLPAEGFARTIRSFE